MVQLFAAGWGTIELRQQQVIALTVGGITLCGCMTCVVLEMKLLFFGVLITAGKTTLVISAKMLVSFVLGVTVSNQPGNGLPQSGRGLLKLRKNTNNCLVWFNMTSIY